MSFPQLGYPQYLSASQAVYGGGERPAGLLTPSTRGGSSEMAGNPSAAAAAVSSVLGMYTNPYAAQHYSAFLPYTSADLALFSQMGSQYDLKDSPGVHPASFAAHTSPAFYPYGQFQYGDPARPKNATRESTSTLKAWLNEHRKNPYPTKGEKIMLAIITKMTLTQVSTWFANARRRLKKENKMTWPPRNKCSDEKRYDEDEDGSQEEQIKSETNDDENTSREDKDLQLSDLEDFDTIESESSECELKHQYHLNTHMTTTDCPNGHIKDTSLKISIPVSLGGEQQDSRKTCLKTNSEDCEHDVSNNGRQAKTCYEQGHQILDGKPRIWSLAQTATSLNQTEYPSCMLRCQPSMSPSPVAESPVHVHDRQDSPVTTLRNWVDGVFHDPLFRHSTLNQALSNTSVSWTTTTKGSILETGALERSLGSSVVKGHAPLQHEDSTKDTMSFPKNVNKLFCS